MKPTENVEIDKLLQKASEMMKQKIQTRQVYNREIAKIVSHFIEEYPDLRYCQILSMLGISENGEDRFNEEPYDTYEKVCSRLEKGI